MLFSDLSSKQCNKSLRACHEGPMEKFDICCEDVVFNKEMYWYFIRKTTQGWHTMIKKINNESTGINSWLNETFKKVMDDISSGIIICGKELKILYINKFYAHLLGTNQDKALGMDIRDFFPDSRVPNVFRTGRPELRQQCYHRAEIIGHHTDVMLLVNRIPIKQKGETVAVVIEHIFSDMIQVKDFLNQNNLLKQKVNQCKQKLDSAFSPTYTFSCILGDSERIIRAKNKMKKLALSDGPLLFQGKTGVGKELFAHAAHLESKNCDGPFVCVNCAAIPRELIESELFGYEKGAFTGAKQKGKSGKIEMANKGTLFLDEIGDLPLSAQSKILRVLENKTIEKLGGTGSLKIDFRLISATNLNLEKMVQRKVFREDLFYRINTLTVMVPELSERLEDIPLLVKHFIMTSDKPQLNISKEALEVLAKYSWPGNIRELKSVILLSVSLCDGPLIKPEHLPGKLLMPGIQSIIGANKENSLAQTMHEFEKIIISDALESAGGNKVKTAKELGISRSTLYEKCNVHGFL
jgi:transcriptional regulator with PAS, ATPase and Fis domain